jgi:hypothetical protein
MDVLMSIGLLKQTHCVLKSWNKSGIKSNFNVR